MTSRTAILIMGLLMPLAAAAQEWKTYTYPDPGFSIEFPADPVVQTSRIKNALGTSLPMTHYEVRQDRIVYTLSVVNYSLTNADALTTIVETERALSKTGKVTGASGARIKRDFGRQFMLEGSDGSRSAVAIFFVNKQLYTVVGQALPPNPNEGSSDAIHFDASLQFADENGGWFGGLSGLFGGGVSSPRSGASSRSGYAESGGSGYKGASGVVESRPRPASNLPADATCAGKSAGDTVQLETPGGPVPAICTLVARPITPPAPVH